MSVSERAALIAKAICTVSDVADTFTLNLDPKSDDISIIFSSDLAPEEINPLCDALTHAGYDRYDVDEHVVFQSFLSGLVMAAIRINTKKSNIVLTFNT